MSPESGASARISAARTFLFVPGDRPDRFDKAVASGADIVILDLEDAVTPAAKDVARNAVGDWLRAGNSAVVRINASGSDWFEEDLALSACSGLLGIMLPKAEVGSALDRVAAMSPVVALIESAAGVADIQAIARRSGVVRLAFGTIDLALDLDTTSDEVLVTIGTQFVVASRAAGLSSPIDGVTVGFKDPALVQDAMQLARTRGFGAKLCIHPAQLAAVRQALAPSAEDIARAMRIIEADRASGGAAVALDGQMVDKPLVAKAQRLLADAKSL
ncbi:HpcH/HpaI aldolase/citrate lyase family protein [Sphingomonas abietis]|uniref:CoA ester lyase n=1 Tax=Sphingomonas abietis TaxID=3012344 RepID=A0ABY7NJG0_9SPHN|nr:CoA ester lyase [Sphingomonas abietis]WBO20737.1 CoA ester lyase [Sphingomonas abietis]